MRTTIPDDHEEILRNAAPHSAYSDLSTPVSRESADHAGMFNPLVQSISAAHFPNSMRVARSMGVDHDGIPAAEQHALQWHQCGLLTARLPESEL